MRDDIEFSMQLGVFAPRNKDTRTAHTSLGCFTVGPVFTDIPVIVVGVGFIILIFPPLVLVVCPIGQTFNRNP